MHNRDGAIDVVPVHVEARKGLNDAAASDITAPKQAFLPDETVIPLLATYLDGVKGLYNVKVVVGSNLRTKQKVVSAAQKTAKQMAVGLLLFAVSYGLMASFLKELQAA